MGLRLNKTLQALRTGQIVLGGETTGGFRVVPLIYAAAGLDFIWIDMEHSSVGSESVVALAQTARLIGITPLVRVSSPEYHLICPLLDNGVQGIIVPRMEDPEVIARVISYRGFAPRGTRGCGSPLYANDYQSIPFTEYVATAHEQILMAIQAESRRAVEAIGEIAAVPGLDLVIIGPADLSISLGLGGQLDHPLLIKSALHIIAACRAQGVAVGIAGVSDFGFWITQGVRFLSCLNDVHLLSDACQRRVEEIRSGADA